MKPEIEFIFSEFGPKSLRPPVENVKGFFPEAFFVHHTEKTVPELFDRSHPRWGWRSHDYWQCRGMAKSRADIAIGMDSDMRIVSKDVQAIVPLVQKFGLCLVAASRMLVRVDAEIGADSDRKLDETKGTAYCFTTAWMALDRGNPGAVAVLEEAAGLMLTAPARLPQLLWRAIWKTGFAPLILPQNWTVCAGDEGIGNEIALHIGHREVAEHYKGQYDE